MTRDEYLKSNFEAYNSGKISAEAFEAAIMNINNFVDEPDDEIWDDGELECRAEEDGDKGLLHFAYELYKRDWCKSRGVSLEDIDDENGINGGECYVSLEEFEQNEFQDKEYMKFLFDEVPLDRVIKIAEKQRILSERVIMTKDKDIGDGR